MAKENGRRVTGRVGGMAAKNMGSRDGALENNWNGGSKGRAGGMAAKSMRSREGALENSWNGGRDGRENWSAV